MQTCVFFSRQELILGKKQTILTMKQIRNKAKASLHIGKQQLW